MKKLLLLPLLFAALSSSAQKYPFNDPKLTIQERTEDLISRMTLEEKISQMTHQSSEIERLGIKSYNWWNECLHGVGRSKDMVTVFPQAIGLAATFNAQALEDAADIISTEARAIYNNETRNGNFGQQYKGLTFWTPNINIFRDPRWGRGQETYGEDPYLSGIMGSAMVRGLQGTDDNYLKASACAKHFAVHSGPEHNRHSFDVEVSKHDLWDTYLPAFRELVVNAKVSSVMCAYNRYAGQPCCGSDLLMRAILLNNWKFEGYTTSDCGGVTDFHMYHKTHPNKHTSAADAVLHGTDLECGDDYRSLGVAIKEGLITEDQIDIALRRLIATRIKLGMFDEFGSGKYDNIPYSVLEAPEHKSQALKMARESMVLLKNDGALPFKRLRKVAVIGPNGDNGETQLGNYNGHPSNNVTVLKALKAEGVEVVYHKGCDFASSIEGVDIDAIVNDCKGVDAIIFVGGISPRLEGEAGDAGNDMVEGFAGGDRSSIALPSVQKELVAKLKKTKRPIIFVNMSGSAIAFGSAAENSDAVIQAWYGGQETGNAVCDIILGRYNPSGRLPVTFYNSDNDLPDFEDYAMQGRTYRYFNGRVAYPFGYGLSYTNFTYSNLELASEVSTDGDLKVSVLVKNSGSRSGDEVVQLYTSNRKISELAPIVQLRGVEKITLAKGESKRVEFTIAARDLGYVTKDGELIRTAGELDVFVGGVNPATEYVAQKGAPMAISKSVKVVGEAKKFDL